MKRALLILSLITLFALIAAEIGQTLIETQGVTYDPNGRIVDSTPLAVFSTVLASAGLLLSFPLSLATFIVGLVAMILRHQSRWVVAVIVAGVLGFMGLLVMAWVLLSTNSPVTLVLPFILVPLVTLLYSAQSATGKHTSA
jgi:hypothetical protein